VLPLEIPQGVAALTLELHAVYAQTPNAVCTKCVPPARRDGPLRPLGSFEGVPGAGSPKEGLSPRFKPSRAGSAAGCGGGFPGPRSFPDRGEVVPCSPNKIPFSVLGKWPLSLDLHTEKSRPSSLLTPKTHRFPCIFPLIRELKAVVRLSAPWVRIPPPPPISWPSACPGSGKTRCKRFVIDCSNARLWLRRPICTRG